MSKIDNLHWFVVFSLALSSAAFARIGETEDECGKRYGDVMVRQNEGSGIVKIGYASEDEVVIARFLEGKAVSLTFTKFNDKDEEVPFTNEELDGLLGAYGSRQDWRTVHEDEIKGKLLINASQELIANVGGNLHKVVITAKEFAEAGINKGRETPIKAPEGVW
jgi:hypothetical protein